MDRSGLAELLLSSVLPAERAAAVTGDFLEEFEGRGGFRFWSRVFRTAAAAVASDFVRRPLWMLAIGIAGSLRTMAPGIALALLIGPLAAHRDLLGFVVLLTGFCMAVWQVRCGMWLARYRPESAIASCMAVIATGWLFILLVTTTPARTVNQQLVSASGDVLLLAGAAMQRRRAGAHGS
jgi:hypothetical protein